MRSIAAPTMLRGLVGLTAMVVSKFVPPASQMVSTLAALDRGVVHVGVELAAAPAPPMAIIGAVSTVTIPTTARILVLLISTPGACAM